MLAQALGLLRQACGNGTELFAVERRGAASAASVTERGYDAVLIELAAAQLDLGLAPQHAVASLAEVASRLVEGDAARAALTFDRFGPCLFWAC